jgi:hypothetical protein
MPLLIINMMPISAASTLRSICYARVAAYAKLRWRYVRDPGIRMRNRRSILDMTNGALTVTSQHRRPMTVPVKLAILQLDAVLSHYACL